MPRAISEKTFQETTRCVYDFQCLTEGNAPKCCVTRPVEGDGVFVETPEQQTCPYLLLFGDASVCNCPTRFEVYQRYKM